jgi:hypothetical protein
MFIKNKIIQILSQSIFKFSIRNIKNSMNIHSDIIKCLEYQLKRSRINHEQQLLKQPNLLSAHIYCLIHNLSAQIFGPLLEKYIISTFHFQKNSASDCIGDCLNSKDSKDSKENIEIKVSLGGSSHNKFNYVQIRMSHNITSYIFTAYYLNQDNISQMGELFVFKIPKEELKEIILNHGSYSHGTKKEHGQITIDSLNNTHSLKEYSLRPRFNDNCWKALMKFRILKF